MKRQPFREADGDFGRPLSLLCAAFQLAAVGGDKTELKRNAKCVGEDQKEKKENTEGKGHTEATKW